MSDLIMPKLRKAFDKARAASEERGYIYGTIGRTNEDGSISVVVSGRPRYLYVTVDGEHASTIARNNGVPNLPGLPIRMKRQRNELVIVGVNELGLEAFLSGGGGGSYTVPVHTHNPGSGLEYPVNPLRVDMGRIRFVSALTVRITAFWYWHNGARAYWPGGDIDLTSVQPGTSGHHAWIVVGVDPATNTAVAVAGTSQSTGTALTVAQIGDVAFTGYIPCGAVKMTDTDTSLGLLSKYADARLWFGLTGLVAAADLTDAAIPTKIDDASAKATPVDADTVGLVDSADSNALKKLSWANIKATLKAYFDTIYAAIVHSHAAADVTSGTFANARISQSSVTQHQGAIDHGSIAGLNGDDHAGYARLAGRAGGQNYRGGTAASENLTLESTAHATKGDVSIQPNGGDILLGGDVILNSRNLIRGLNQSNIFLSGGDANNDGGNLAMYGSAHAATPGVIRFRTGTTVVIETDNAGLVGVGGAPTTSAKLAIHGTDGALLLPRLTTTQRNALTATAGMAVYDSTLAALAAYVNAAWRQVATLSQAQTWTAKQQFADEIEFFPSSTDVGSITAYPSGSAPPGTVGGINFEPTSGHFVAFNTTHSTLVLPRMTTTQRNNISGAPDGSLIYNTTDDKVQARAGGAWVNLH